jgi:hypothetical protein
MFYSLVDAQKQSLCIHSLNPLYIGPSATNMILVDFSASLTQLLQASKRKHYENQLLSNIELKSLGLYITISPSRILDPSAHSTVKSSDLNLYAI